MAKLPRSRADNNPWPKWPLIYRLDYGHEEVKDVFGVDPRQYLVKTKEFITNNGTIVAVKTAVVDISNNFAELPDSEKIWDADLVLLAIGFISAEHYLSDKANITLDNRGNYMANYGNYATSKKGIFAAGDCRRGQSLVVWAMNEGRGAAKKIDEYLKND